MESSFSRRVGQALHRGVAWFQQALVAPACPGCMDMAPWPTSSRFPMFSSPTSQPLGPSLCLWQLLLRAALGSHLCCVAGTLHGLAFSRGHRTSNNTLACLGRLVGCQYKHFSSPLPWCRLDEDLYFPKALVGEEGQRVTLRSGMSEKSHNQSPRLLLPGSQERCETLPLGLY